MKRRILDPARRFILRELDEPPESPDPTRATLVGWREDGHQPSVEQVIALANQGRDPRLLLWLASGTMSASQALFASAQLARLLLQELGQLPDGEQHLDIIQRWSRAALDQEEIEILTNSDEEPWDDPFERYASQAVFEQNIVGDCAFEALYHVTEQIGGGEFEPWRSAEWALRGLERRLGHDLAASRLYGTLRRSLGW